ncbi:hypothetical protein GJ744_010592 [Endocarpon pusillum]|uniref:Uncharacterized protein n=1 Tax=Endocarpon pusillum TaxID=364733 RepID=A0A8H7AU37_9EURO|nr:hypothetical protein GJ744_010592 [Endocarpon pusillum]
MQEKRQLGAVTGVAGQVSETADNLEIHSINEKRQEANLENIITSLTGIVRTTVTTATGDVAGTLASILTQVVNGILAPVVGGVLQTRDDSEFHNID